MNFLKKTALTTGLMVTSFSAFASTTPTPAENSMVALIVGGLGLIALLTYRVNKEKPLV